MKHIFKSCFADYMIGIIKAKRQLGYKYEEEEGTLANLDTYIVDNGFNSLSGLTKELCDSWIHKNKEAKPLTIYGNICVFNSLSLYMNEMGVMSYMCPYPKYPDCEYVPYIFTHEEIQKIFNCSDEMTFKLFNPKSPFMAMPALIRFAYGTGSRLGEIISADEKDVDIDNLLFTVHKEKTKNGKARIIPFDISLGEVLKQYLHHKRNVVKMPSEGWECSSLFTNLLGERLKKNVVYHNFIKILKACGIMSRGTRQGPNFHCLRHTMACHSFYQMSHCGIDLYASWPYLSVYLGHQSLESTEKYVRLTSELYPELIHKDDIPFMELIKKGGNDESQFP
jgi:integrase/recombinase XerD